MNYSTFNQLACGDGTVPYTVYNGCDLRRLAKSITENVEVYLQSLDRNNIPPPTFHPNSSTASTTEKVGQDAQRALVDASERIVALTTGPPGLYNLSRQVRIEFCGL